MPRIMVVMSMLESIFWFTKEKPLAVNDFPKPTTHQRIKKALCILRHHPIVLTLTTVGWMGLLVSVK